MTIERKTMVVFMRESGARAVIAEDDYNPSQHRRENEEDPKAANTTNGSTKTAKTDDDDLTPGVIATVNSDEAKELIEKVDSIEELDKLQADEEASQKHEGGRKGVLEAIEAKRAELTKDEDDEE